MIAVTQLAYVLSTALFIFALHWMNDPKTARRGVQGGVAAMVLAILATWAQPQVIVHHVWIAGAIALFASMTNIVSGFLITDRMLKMFKTNDKPGDGQRS